MTTSATTLSSPSGSTALAYATTAALASALYISTIFMFVASLAFALGTVGFSAIAVAGWKRQIPRGAAVVLILAAFVSLAPPYPPGALLGAVGLAWVIRSRTMATSARREPARS